MVWTLAMAMSADALPYNVTEIPPFNSDSNWLESITDAQDVSPMYIQTYQEKCHCATDRLKVLEECVCGMYVWG